MHLNDTESCCYLMRLCAFLQNETILLISRARVALAPPLPARRVPSSILDRKSLEKGLPTLLWFPSYGTDVASSQALGARPAPHPKYLMW